MRLSKALIFAFGVVVGGAIGSVATYIFFGRKAEEKAIDFYEEQVELYKKHKDAKKIIPLEEKKPVHISDDTFAKIKSAEAKNNDSKTVIDSPSSPSERLKFKRDKDMYKSYSKLTEPYRESERDSGIRFEILGDDAEEKIDYNDITHLICYPDEQVIEYDRDEEDLGDFDDFDDYYSNYVFDSVGTFGIDINDYIFCVHLGESVTGDHVNPAYIYDHSDSVLYRIAYSWSPSRRAKLAGVDDIETG